MNIFNIEEKTLEAELSSELEKQFSKEEVELIAREVEFVRRNSKINGFNFLDLVVFNNEYLKRQSLNDLAMDFEARTGIEIEKQTIHERFNESAVNFLKKYLKRLSKIKLASVYFWKIFTNSIEFS